MSLPPGRFTRFGRRRPGRKSKRGAVYARFSSRFQHSTADQVRACLEWATQNGIDVSERHIFFDEKTTGKKNRRAGFQALMRAVAEDEVDVVIIFTTSRLFRKTYRALMFVEEEIVDREKRCVFVKSGPIDTDDRENWRKLMQLNTMVDEMQVQMQAAHIRTAHEGQLRLGVVFGTLTYGYTGEDIQGQKTKLGKQARRIVTEPKAAEWVRQIFAWFADDELTIAEIVRGLNGAGAPLPKRERVVRWTRLIVRRILDNPRYRGLWQYGEKEAVWQNKQDYSRQFKREQALAVVELPHLRIIDEATWHKAQKRLADCHAKAGRKPKNGSASQYPRLLNRICYCEKHKEQQLWVGGAHGKYLFCPACRTDPQRALVSQMPRVLATKLLCTALSSAIRADSDVVEHVIESCRQQAGGLQRPDPATLDRHRQEEQKLTQQIKFVMNAPGETEQDQAENQSVLTNLRRQRTIVQAEIQRLQAAAGKEIKVPTVEEVKVLLDDFADVLIQAVGSSDESKVAAARRIVQALTGGRIVISQQGEPLAKRGWLRATFRLQLLRPMLESLGANAAERDQGVEVNIDIRKPTEAEDLGEEAKALLDTGMLVKEIALELSQRHGRRLGRNMVAKALKHWFSSHDLPVPDGRSRRKTLARKSIHPNLAAQIADRVMELNRQGMLYTEIAEKLDIDHTTLTAAVKHWHLSRGLPVPDGRTRRKDLHRKSRSRDTTPKASLPHDPCVE